MKRAKLWGVKENAAVVLGNIRHSDDVGGLTHPVDDPVPSALRESR